VIYSFQDPSLTFILDNESAVNTDFVERAKAFLQTTPIYPLAIIRDSETAKEIQAWLARNIASVKRMGVTIRETKFFEDKSVG